MLLAISPAMIVTLSIAGVLTIATIIMYFVGRKLEKKQTEQKVMMEQNKQTVSMLIIDKKKVKFKDAGFSQAIIDQTPKYSRRMKVPVVKAKVGPQIVTLIADNDIFDSIPVKREVKAVISGMYIMSVRDVRGKNSEPAPKKKKNFLKRTLETLQEKAGANPIEADKKSKKKK